MKPDPRTWGARPLLAAMALLCLAAVGLALVTQHVFDMQPCPWCVLQRLVFAAIAAAAGLGALWPARTAQLGAALVAALLALGGISAALWQHFVAASSTSCNLTLADRIMSATGLDMAWPEVFAAYASCAEAKVDLLGLPYEFYSLTLFALLGLAAWQVVRRR